MGSTVSSVATVMVSFLVFFVVLRVKYAKRWERNIAEARIGGCLFLYDDEFMLPAVLYE